MLTAKLLYLKVKNILFRIGQNLSRDDDRSIEKKAPSSSIFQVNLNFIF
jgi:hypothetical protein